jgi:hypothetical protein
MGDQQDIARQQCWRSSGQPWSANTALDSAFAAIKCLSRVVLLPQAANMLRGKQG